MFKLPKLGQPLHRVEKSATETINYLIDLTDVLEPNEVVLGITCNYSSRSKRGKFIEVCIPSSIFDSTAAYIDTKVDISFNTSFNNTRSASFIVRTYR